MINKLRMKFVLVAMIAITIVTIAIFGMIQIDNHVRTNRQIDEIINIIIENNGTIPKKNFSNRTNPYINQETRYTTRYFTATLDDDNEILNIDMDNISSVSEDEANKIINNIIKKSKVSGNIENFRYKYSKDEKIIVVIDCTAQIINQKQFTQKANIIIIAGLFVTFGLWIVKSLAKFILVTFGITLSGISIAVIVILIYIVFIVIIPLLIMIFDDKKKK